jgi:protein TonB
VGRFRERIQQRLVYPWLAVRRGLSGVIELEVRLDAAGRLVSVGASGPDGPRILRDAAAQAVRDATPFPLPSELAPRPLTIRLPVVFELK